MNEGFRQAAEQVINGTAGQVIDKAGYASIGTGLGLKAAEQEKIITQVAGFMDLTITEWAAVASIAGAISLVVKNIFEMWWKARMERKYGRPNDR